MSTVYYTHRDSFEAMRTAKKRGVSDGSGDYILNEKHSRRYNNYTNWFSVARPTPIALGNDAVSGVTSEGLGDRVFCDCRRDEHRGSAPVRRPTADDPFANYERSWALIIRREKLIFSAKY